MTSVHEDGQIEFRFFRPQATHVSLVGEFNDWDHDHTPMRRDPHGWWIAKVKLPPGEYRFRYYARGEWYTDFASHGVERENNHWNSVILVSQANEPRIAA